MPELIDAASLSGGRRDDAENSRYADAAGYASGK